LKVLIIPSWYPYPGLPHAGIFTVIQAQALTRTNDVDVSILNWGQLEYQLALRHPWQSIIKLWRYAFSKQLPYHYKSSLQELTLKHLTWTHHVLTGNIDRLIPKLAHLPEFDLIHAHVAFPAGYVAMKLAQARGIPYIITEHSGPFPLPGLCKGSQVSSLVSKPMNEAAAIVAVSTSLARDIECQLGISPHIIPNLIDTEFYYPSPQIKPHDRFTLFALSALTEAKGVLDLLEAANILKSMHCNVVIKLAGSGPLYGKLHKLIKTNNLHDHLLLLGQLNPMQALSYYQSCDCFIMPSRLESFSMVLLEAMACGKPLIATACGGPVDIVHPTLGMLIPPANPQALAEAVVAMVDNYDQYSSQTIREHCLQYYAPEVVCGQIRELYLQTLAP